jgi:predicted amidohydrolase YtcJ
MHWITERVGEERSRYAYAWRTLLGIFAAVTRQDRGGWPEGGWHPEQKLSREEALRMFTIDAAYSVFEEDIKGSITPGKLADAVVLSKDIMTIPTPEILETEVLMTILGGKIVYDNP